jgi:hypothetical protein
MLKYFLIGVSVLAVAASGAALTDLGDLEYSKTGSGITLRLDRSWYGFPVRALIFA